VVGLIRHFSVDLVTSGPMGSSLPDIFAARKSFSVTPSWVLGEQGKLTMAIPLEVRGVTVEGLLLRLRARQDMPDQEVTAQLECGQLPLRRQTNIDRIDWRPLHHHSNPAKGPARLRLATFRKQSHRHAFGLNWDSSRACIKPGNLLWAQPVTPDPQRFSELLELVSDSFRISGLSVIDLPPWQSRLL
jgi:hypothetical protein